jgi:hypothetical protein
MDMKLIAKLSWLKRKLRHSTSKLGTRTTASVHFLSSYSSSRNLRTALPRPEAARR